MAPKYPVPMLTDAIRYSTKPVRKGFNLLREMNGTLAHIRLLDAREYGDGLLHYILWTQRRRMELAAAFVSS